MQGNVVEVQVSSNNSQVMSLTVDDLSLFTTNRDFSNLTDRFNNNKLVIQNHYDDNAMDDQMRASQNYVFIDVISFNLVDGVTGFRVEPKKTEIEKRWTYDYEAGSSGVGGVSAGYTSNTASGTVELKLSKKTASTNVFWQRLADGEISRPGDFWDYVSSTCYSRYRFGFKGNSSNFDWFWVGSCN